MKKLLKKESVDVIRGYVDKGYLLGSHLIKIMGAEDGDEIVNAMSTFLDKLDREKSDKMILHVIWNVFKGVETDDDKATVFNEERMIFFRELLKNKGILTRSYAVKHIFKNDTIARMTTNQLMEMEIIDQYPMYGFEIIYLLNLDFYKEVFGDD